MPYYGPGGEEHRCACDLTKLNSQVSRPTHPLPIPFAAVRSVTPSSRFFTTADALHGYWQIELTEEDRHLTTFITPYGRYMHCRGPMGFAATGNTYCLRGDMALQGVTKCVKVVDDILLFDEDLPTHIRRIQLLSVMKHPSLSEKGNLSTDIRLIFFSNSKTCLKGVSHWILEYRIRDTAETYTRRPAITLTRWWLVCVPVWAHSRYHSALKVPLPLRMR